MNLPYRFPDPREEARRRAREFQQLSPTERWTELAAMMAFGLQMVASSPKRQMIEQRMAEEEAEAQQIQRELFRRHGG
jgi:hypothetical protein